MVLNLKHNLKFTISKHSTFIGNETLYKYFIFVMDFELNVCMARASMWVVSRHCNSMQRTFSIFIASFKDKI